MELYLNVGSLNKIAATESALSEDQSQWQTDILQQLYRQAPYVSDFSPTTVITHLDHEQGYGLGHFEVQNQTEAPKGLAPDQEEVIGIKHARIPFVIKDKKLQPLDVVLDDDSKAWPLNEDRLREALFRPQQFDVTSRTPGDQSMIGQLYPPYRQNFGAGGGLAMGGEKMSSALAAERDFEGKLRALEGVSDRELTRKHGATRPESPVTLGDYAGEKKASRKVAGVGSGNTKPVPEASLKLKIKDVIPDQTKKESGSVLDRILTTIYASDYEKFASALQDPQVQAIYLQNRAATAPSLQKLSSAPVVEPYERTRKLASCAVKPQVAQLVRTPDGYTVKTASTVAWLPESRSLDRTAAIKVFGEKVVLAADVSGAVTMSEGPEVMGPSLEEVETEGRRYGVINQFGIYKVQTPDGKELVGFVLPNLIGVDGMKTSLNLFTNGAQHCVQEIIGGEPAGTGINLPQGRPDGYGAFYRPLPNGDVEALVPIVIRGKVEEPVGIKIVGETFAGQPIVIAVQPGIKQPIPLDGTLLLPDDFLWTPMDQTGHVALQDDIWVMNKTSMAHRELLKVTVRASEGQFSFDGIPLDKFAHQDKSFLSLDDSMFLLAGLGVNQKYGATKLGEANTLGMPIEIRVGRIIKTAQVAADQAVQTARIVSSHIPELKQTLFKEAGALPDTVTVDNVLALGFINQENVMVFASALPLLEKSQNRLCELLIAARVGLTDIPIGALEKTIRAMEQVINGLKVVAFSAENQQDP